MGIGDEINDIKGQINELNVKLINLRRRKKYQTLTNSLQLHKEKVYIRRYADNYIRILKINNIYAFYEDDNSVTVRLESENILIKCRKIPQSKVTKVEYNPEYVIEYNDFDWSTEEAVLLKGIGKEITVEQFEKYKSYLITIENELFDFN